MQTSPIHIQRAEHVRDVCTGSELIRRIVLENMNCIRLVVTDTYQESGPCI